MSHKPMKNQFIRLRSAKGEIHRVVIDVNGEMIAVCRQEELDASRLEHRPPHVSWFPMMDILS
jgi:hypothetical protein